MSQGGNEAATAGARRRLLALFAAVGAVLIVLVTISLYSMHRLDRIVSVNLEQTDALTAMADNARITQVAFKTQVQEWKNILLRGHNPTDFDSYHRAFLAQRDKVRDGFTALVAEAKALDFPAGDLTRLEALATANLALDDAYEQALLLFKADDPLSIRTVDAQMRGRDRPINDEFDGLAASVQNFTDDHRQRLRAEIGNAIEGMRSTLYFSLAAGLVILLVAAFVGMRALRAS
jgi:hypothetical protein